MTRELNSMNTARTSAHRSSLLVRIAWIIGICLALAGAGVCGVNLVMANLYNTATEQLHTAIADYSTSNPDLEALAISQAQTDSLFTDASSLAWLQIPGLNNNLAHNQRLSAKLTQQIQDDLRKKEEKEQNNQPSANTSSSDTESDSSASSSSDSQSTLDENVQDRMKTLLDHNTASNNQVEPQAPKNHTKKPW
ncbi:DUF6466 family protein [Alloscardovia omnicolens]|uniref:DUF6466 family protein n=1 Tax=Alloscardovia omnicolens TaxID=419015 RepID=UPI003A77EF20